MYLRKKYRFEQYKEYLDKWQEIRITERS